MDNQLEPHFCINCVNCAYKESLIGEDLSKCNARENMELDLVTGKLKHKENRAYCSSIRKYKMQSAPQCAWFEPKSESKQ